MCLLWDHVRWEVALLPRPTLILMYYHAQLLGAPSVLCCMCHMALCLAFGISTPNSHLLFSLWPNCSRVSGLGLSYPFQEAFVISCPWSPSCVLLHHFLPFPTFSKAYYSVIVFLLICPTGWYPFFLWGTGSIQVAHYSVWTYVCSWNWEELHLACYFSFNINFWTSRLLFFNYWILFF